MSAVLTYATSLPVVKVGKVDTTKVTDDVLTKIKTTYFEPHRENGAKTKFTFEVPPVHDDDCFRLRYTARHNIPAR